MTPIRTATNTALTPIKVGISPDNIAITPSGQTAYVSTAGPQPTSQPGTVSLISIATNTTLAPIKVGKGPACIVIMPSRSGLERGTMSCTGL